MRELGRREEPAGNPFRPMRSDEVTRQVPPGKPDRPIARPVPREPEPAPNALVTSIRSGSRILIAAASPEARAIGLYPGMAITQARALAPGLDIRPADPEDDAAALRRLALLAAQRWSPTVAIAGADTLLIELTGVSHLHGGEARMARLILGLLAKRGFTARIAIADTAGAAWALAHASPDMTQCPPGQHAAALAPLPIVALRAEPADVELLRRLGIETIGQLAAMPSAPLVRRFGAPLATRLAQALGELPEPLTPVIPREAIAVTRRFAEPVATAEGIAHWIGALVPELCARLEASGEGARMVDLVADRVDGRPQHLRIGLARASRDPLHLQRLIVRRIETIEPGFGIDAITLHVRRAQPLTPQPFDERLDEAAKPDLAPLADTLATRIGPHALWRLRPVESDVPERSVARDAILDPPGRALKSKADDIRQLDRTDPPDPWHPRWPRPVRLLPRPELLDHVLAELPDQPPRRFTWRGRTIHVARADGPERITGEWWRRAAETHAIRDYFRVEDEEGHRYWLFRRGDGERAVTGDLHWYLHGLFG
jgi:protein ImuB